MFPTQNHRPAATLHVASPWTNYVGSWGSCFFGRAWQQPRVGRMRDQQQFRFHRPRQARELYNECPTQAPCRIYHFTDLSFPLDGGLLFFPFQRLELKNPSPGDPFSIPEPKLGLVAVTVIHSFTPASITALLEGTWAFICFAIVSVFNRTVRRSALSDACRERTQKGCRLPT